MTAQRAGRRAALRVLAAALACVGLSGCWGAQFVRMPSYTEETRADVIDLTARNEELLKRLSAMEAKMSDQTELLRALRAESASEMGSLQERIETLEQQIGTSGESRPKPQARTAPAPADSAPSDSASASARGPNDHRAQYDSAYLELLKGNYDLAIQGFLDFLAQNPESDLADNAQYWIGECHVARGETALAVDAFAAVETRWPGSDKIPDALFKIATCHQSEHHNGAARRTYQDLIARFPNSEKAQLARERLALLPAGE